LLLLKMSLASFTQFLQPYYSSLLAWQYTKEPNHACPCWTISTIWPHLSLHHPAAGLLCRVFFHNGEQPSGAPTRGYRYFTATNEDLIARWFGNGPVPGAEAQREDASSDLRPSPQHSPAPSAPAMPADRVPLYTVGASLPRQVSVIACTAVG
jgi:hypothetical protein